MTVTAVVVSHDGARWLPAVLDALGEQTRAPDRIVAVDTGSADHSPALLRERLGESAVLSCSPRTSYAAAVSRALGALPPSTSPDDWVWLLHDDSAPAADALERLLDVVSADPGIAAAGPKLREWPSLRRLLELGVTISGTGRRETGLERGEYDQGQHDRIREVLAVNTAGLLVRREVLEGLGMDSRLPVFGTDLDFGWRAARAGHRTMVVPQAVVFHVEAASRGLRRTQLTGRHFPRAQRSAALYTLLVNGPTAGLPFRLVRLFAGSLLRTLGFLLVRAPGEAFDEVVALLATYARPDRIVAGRLARRRTAQVPHRVVRPLLAPAWVPYRHGLDFVSDVAAAVVNQAGDLSAARRARVVQPVVEAGPADEESVSLADDTGLVARALTSATGWVLGALLLVAVLSMRGHVGAGMLSGGALLPAPDGAAHWWSTAFSGWHDGGVGAATSAAPYLLPLALAGTLLLGKAWLVVDGLFFLAVPLAAWGARRFLSRVTGSRRAALWGGVAYGLYPVLSGSVQQGRLGSVVAAVVLPWLAHAAWALVAGETADRRWRAAFRTALWLALLAAFVPLAYPVAAAGALVLAVVLAVSKRAQFRRSAGPLTVSLAVAFLLLLPWAATVWRQPGPAAWLVEAGRPATGLLGQLGRLDVVLARPGQAGSAPAWLNAALLVAALLALVRPDTRSRVLGAWTVTLLGLATTAVLAGARVELASWASPQRLWLGFPLLLVHAGTVTAAAIAGTGIRQQLARTAFGWRQPVGLVVTVAALVTPVLGVVWWGFHGTGQVLDRRAVSIVPAYMTDDASHDRSAGVLLVRGSANRGFRYAVLRQRGLRLGDDTVLPSVADFADVTDVVGEVAGAPTADTVTRLREFGVGYVYAPAPVDVQLAGNLDSVGGVAPASALARGARAWALEAGAGSASRPAHPDRLHPWLTAAELGVVVVVAVLAAPTRRRERP